MPTQFTDFLQTFMGLKQIQNQTEQVAQTARSQAVSGLDTFMKMAQHTANPMEQTALVDRFSQLGVASREQLMGVLQHITPTAEAMKEYDIWRGRQLEDAPAGAPPDPTVTPAGRTRMTEAANANSTGQNAGQLGSSQFLRDMFSLAPRSSDNAAEMASRLTGGMSTGETAIDRAMTALPGSEVTQAAGVKAGTRMSAAQDANVQLGFGQLRSQDRRNTAESAYQMGTLEVEAAKAKAAALGHDPQMVDHLISAKTSLMATLKDAKNKNPSAQELMAFIGGLNAINQQMTQLGIANEGQIDYKPEMLTQPGLYQSILNRLNSGTKLTSTPPGTAPAGAGRR